MSSKNLCGKCLSGEMFNLFLNQNNMGLIKFFNTDEIHRDYSYMGGLNKDPNPFTPEGEGRKGGFYFFIEQEMNERSFCYIHFKISHLRSIIIPNNAQVYIEDGKCKADKIILGERIEPLEYPGFQEMCNSAVQRDSLCLGFVPDILKTREMCDSVVEKYPWCLEFVPEKFKHREMCDSAVGEDPNSLEFVPEKFKHREMCESAVEKYPWCLEFVPDNLKTREMCNNTVNRDIRSV